MSNPFSTKAGKSPSGSGSSKKVKTPARSASSKRPKKIQRSVTPLPKSSSGFVRKTSSSRQTTNGESSANPWSSHLGKTDSLLPSSRTKTISTKTTRRGISQGGRSAAASSSPSRRSQKQSGYTIVPVPTGPDVSEVSVGDRVRLTWAVDPAYAMPGSGEFVGVVTVLNDWITVVDNKSVKFHYPVSTLGGVAVLGVAGRTRGKVRRVRV